MKRPYFICDHVPPRSQSGSGCAEPSIRQPAAGERAVGEQLHAARAAHGRQRPGRAPVEQREADLVRNHLDAAGEHHAADARRPRSSGRCGAIKPSALQRPADAAGRRSSSDRRSSRRGTAAGRSGESRSRCSDRSTAARTSASVSGPGFGTHFVNSCTGCAASAPSRRWLGHDLGRPVVIGHVERREAGVDVGAHRPRRGARGRARGRRAPCRRSATGR